ncbi:hypothetical protein [Nocardioides sp. B-3]|uniref:hypothetical protein n=1 Tax=Nocardioides sp. B-3 TaxID=2895565 RepID=UPI0021520DA5|nr:hypothetical protein [Nocardioides sp. B-3]UUZ58782.1 hypothetical protein LP418_22250 [Nocardioides sp. B-3]
MIPFSGAAAIAGIGATEFSKASGRSELQLSCEATLSALADAGLTPADVDGLVTFTMDNSSEIALARELGMGELSFFSRINYGGGAACATVQQAAMAVATGMATTVVAYRGFNERSGDRFGRGLPRRCRPVNTNGLDNALDLPARALHAGRDGRHAGPGATCTSTAQRRPTSGAWPWPTGGTRPPTRPRSSTRSRSRSPTTGPRA